MLPVIEILVGIVLLLMGRRLFWLLVGLLGFIVAAGVATDVLTGQPWWLVVIIALAAGLLGALIAAALQRLAIGIAGFLAGFYIAYNLLGAIGVESATVLGWILAVLGGVVGAVLALVVVDWALITLSSLVGAAAVAGGLGLERSLAFLVFVAALVVGITVQSRSLDGRRPPPRPPRRRRA